MPFVIRDGSFLEGADGIWYSIISGIIKDIDVLAELSLYKDQNIHFAVYFSVNTNIPREYTPITYFDLINPSAAVKLNYLAVDNIHAYTFCFWKFPFK